MFGTLGGPELLLILIIALIVFGPKKLPEIGRSLGRMMVEFRKATTDFKQTVENEIEADKLRSMVSDAPRIEPPRAPVEPAGVQPRADSRPGEAPAAHAGDARGAASDPGEPK